MEAQAQGRWVEDFHGNWQLKISGQLCFARLEIQSLEDTETIFSATFYRIKNKHSIYYQRAARGLAIYIFVC